MKKQKTEKLATLSIEKQTVNKIKEYCLKRGLKIGFWVTQILTETIEKTTKLEKNNQVREKE